MISRGGQQTEAGPSTKPDASFSFLPDLIIIDCSKGQLGRAVSVLEKFDLQDKIPIVELAKQNEEIFFSHRSEPLLLLRHTQALYLVQRIRDESIRSLDQINWTHEAPVTATRATGAPSASTPSRIGKTHTSLLY
jgi:hypothetical protein